MSEERVSRREFLKGAATLAAASLSACSVPGSNAPLTSGALRLGMAGGATSDRLDPRTFVDWVPINIGYQLMNGLVEIDAHGNAIPELFERWEPSDDLREWVFDVRRDVPFHNGKTLDADDVIYSINLHRGRTASTAKAAVENIEQLRKLDAYRVHITLAGGDAELPATLSDYRLLVVPNGFENWAHPIGTGAYRLDYFEPGVRCVTRKAGPYWKPNAGHVEAIELLVINDVIARTQALIAGQVDAINRIDGRTADLLKRNHALQVVRSQTGQHAVFAMNCESQVLASNDVRSALKYAIDREHVIKTVLNGYGQLGNDQPIPPTSPYFDASLPQHTYDPGKALFYLRKAGLARLDITLHVSDAAFTGALDAAILYQAAAAQSNVTLNVKREPADGYWSNVWLRVPFCASYSDGRTTVDAMLAKAYKTTAPNNETFWRRPQFDALANEARAEPDVNRRKALYGACQRLIAEDGGALIPMFMDHIEAGSTRVQGWQPSAIYDFMGQRLGEKVWLQS